MPRPFIRNRSLDHSGITLVEIMVATAISMIVMMGLTESVRFAMRTSTAVNTTLDANQVWQRILQILANPNIRMGSGMTDCTRSLRDQAFNPAAGVQNQIVVRDPIIDPALGTARSRFASTPQADNPLANQPSQRLTITNLSLEWRANQSPAVMVGPNRQQTVTAELLLQMNSSGGNPVGTAGATTFTRRSQITLTYYETPGAKGGFNPPAIWDCSVLAAQRSAGWDNSGGASPGLAADTFSECQNFPDRTVCPNGLYVAGFNIGQTESNTDGDCGKGCDFKVSDSRINLGAKGILCCPIRK